jgi:glucose dehydrogenase
VFKFAGPSIGPGLWMKRDYRLGITGFCYLFILIEAHAQTDWPIFGHDPGAMRYSPLKQINTSNVDQLRPSWQYDTTEEDADRRSLGYAPNDTGARDLRFLTPAIVFGTLDGWLISLNAKTGKPNPTFGAEGLVNLNIGVTEKFPKARYAITSPPNFYKNLAITGSSPGEEPAFGATGDIRTWDMRIGKVVCKAVPQSLH